MDKEIRTIKVIGTFEIPIYADDNSEFIEEMKDVGIDLYDKNSVVELNDEQKDIIWDYFNDHVYESIEDMKIDFSLEN